MGVVKQLQLQEGLIQLAQHHIKSLREERDKLKSVSQLPQAVIQIYISHLPCIRRKMSSCGRLTAVRRPKRKSKLFSGKERQLS